MKVWREGMGGAGHREREYERAYREMNQRERRIPGRMLKPLPIAVVVLMVYLTYRFW